MVFKNLTRTPLMCRRQLTENQRRRTLRHYSSSISVDLDNFEKIASSTTAKEAWDILDKFYVGAD